MTIVGGVMSSLEIKSLDANFELWRKDRAPSIEVSKAFERYSIEQILKDADLSDEQIEAGNFGDGDDGAVDGMYFFVNRTLIQDEIETPDPAIEAEVVIIQASTEQTFKEKRVDGLARFTRDLLDYSKEVDEFTYLNSLARDAISLFRSRYEQILASHHTLKFTFYYATKSDTDPHPKLETKMKSLASDIENVISHAQMTWELWGAKKLLNTARRVPSEIYTVQITKDLQSDDGLGAVCLVKIKSLAAFLTDERGLIRTKVLEPNVRAYQGKHNPVNREIRLTLESGGPTEFWWQNNGITLLCKDFKVVGNILTLTAPEIVNGLQTSQEIYDYFHSNKEKVDDRNVMVRVINPKEEKVRNKITRSTNFQTKVDDLSLHATDQLHFDIEDKLKLYHLFYDRRKSARTLRKRISETVSMLDLARCLIAIALGEPDNARGSPLRVIRQQYSRVFDDNASRDLYLACVQLDHQVREHLGTTHLRFDERRDIRYFVDRWLACHLTATATPSSDQIAGLVPTLTKPIPDAILQSSVNAVFDLYTKGGGIDRLVKSQEFRTTLAEAIANQFNAQPMLGGLVGKNDN